MQDSLPYLEQLNGQPLTLQPTPSLPYSNSRALQTLSRAPASHRPLASWAPATPSACMVMIRGHVHSTTVPPRAGLDVQHAAGSLEWVLQQQDAELHAAGKHDDTPLGLVAVHEMLARHTQALLNNAATTLQSVQVPSTHQLSTQTTALHYHSTAWW